jgi:hypothetical protein
MNMKSTVWTSALAILVALALVGCGEEKKSEAAMKSTPSTPATTITPNEPSGPTDEELAKKVIGKWKATITLPPGASDQLKQLQAIQEQAIAQSGPVILELKDDKTYTLKSFSVDYEGNYSVEAGFVEIRPTKINGTDAKSMIGKTVKVSFTEKPVEITEDSLQPANLEILEEGLTLRMDQGQNMTMLVYRRV